ncbi:MAG: DUF2892 domain-containing protein [Pseudomonadales bacterium]|nr:DUF2892 domain-containing protein [Pseudomonadales bacterium]
MKQNVGGADRIIRIIVGLAVIAAGVWFQSWWGAVGLVPLGTALVGWCPPYALLGISTCSVKSGTES